MANKSLWLSLVVFFMISAEAYAISESKCRSNDWFAIGREYGFKGEAEDKVLKDQEACQKRGVEIPLEEYKKGWQMGITDYCSPDSAYKMGVTKKKPTKNCPLVMKPNFEQFYNWGQNAAKIEKDIQKADKELKSKKKALDKAQKQVRKLDGEVEKLEKKSKELKDKVAEIETEMARRRTQITK